MSFVLCLKQNKTLFNNHDATPISNRVRVICRWARFMRSSNPQMVRLSADGKPVCRLVKGSGPSADASVRQLVPYKYKQRKFALPSTSYNKATPVFIKDCNSTITWREKDERVVPVCHSGPETKGIMQS